MGAQSKSGDDTSSPGTSGTAAPSLPRRIATATGVTAAALTFLGLMGAGIVTLHLRAAAEDTPQPPSPTRVETLQIRLEDSYPIQSHYVGLLEAARQTAVSFERSGLVTTILADEGDKVAAGEVIARLDTARLAAARRQLRAQIRELEARQTLAAQTLSRQQRLRSDGVSSQQRLDEATAQMDELAAAIERISAERDAIEIDIEKSTVRAPFAGVVSQRSIDEGAVVTAGTPVLTILEAGKRQARIGLPPEIAKTLDASRRYEIDASGTKVPARLTARRPDIQTGTRTVTALFELEGSSTTPIGGLVTLALERVVEEPGAWVPLTALHDGYRGLWSVYAVIGDAGARRVATEAVEVLHITDDRAYVRGTFRPGTEILTGATHRVVAGQRVALVGDARP